MILPELRRSDSKSAYVQRCRSGNEMGRLPLASVYKTRLCEESYDNQRRLLI